MSPDQADVASLKIVVSIAGGLAAWLALRLESFGHRLVRVEVKLENGLSTKMGELADRMEKHTDGEEARILAAVQRDPKARTRRSDLRSLGRGGVDDA